MSCLRPAPPTRHYLGSLQDSAVASNRRSINVNKKQGKDPETTYDDDMQILRVIEAYCGSKNQRQTIAPTSTIFENLPIPNSEDEKNLSRIDESRQDKALHDLVRSIHEQLIDLKDQNRNLSRRLEDEASARRRLENILKIQNFETD